MIELPCRMLAWCVFALLLGRIAACTLTGPLDLGYSLSADSVHNTEPFTAPPVNETLHHGIMYRSNSFCAGEHTSTHLDAPSHFSENGWTVDQIPFQRLFAKGAFLNVSDEVAGNSSFRLQPWHIDNWIATNGPFPSNAVLLISYGWAQLFHNRTAYLGTTSDDFHDFIYPGMTEETAERLTQIDGLVGVGVDTPSVDPPTVNNPPLVHARLAAMNIYNLEYVNLDHPCLPAKDFNVFSFPMKIVNGTGAPARVFATPSSGFCCQ